MAAEAAAQAATFDVWSEAACQTGGTAIGSGFNAFGGIWDAGVWKDLGGR